MKRKYIMFSRAISLNSAAEKRITERNAENSKNLAINIHIIDRLHCKRSALTKIARCFAGAHKPQHRFVFFIENE